ncbi:unnamed protein product [Albugo candida]|uniref:Anoctamin transmembrane domain-containing protein n=1 Tax=Albugo candida TaxID=65357 RepID=A0A024FST6_9STRA|nr:unnamed protein product [Albugo candida]|eukprot:CCI10063.1 unnamed protein product [Albugo candida]
MIVHKPRGNVNLDAKMIFGEDKSVSIDLQCPPVFSSGTEEGEELYTKSSLLVDEDEKYDIAILLKPSKYQQGPEIGGVEISNADFACYDAYEHCTKKSTNSEAAHPLNLRYDSGFTQKNIIPTKPHQMVAHRICEIGLEVQCLLSIDRKQWLLKVRAPQPLLEFGAEKLRVRKLQRGGCGWVQFASDIRETLKDYDKKSKVVYFSDAEKQRIVYALLTWDPSQHGAGFNAFCMLKTKYFDAIFPLHNFNQLRRLQSRWITYWRYRVTQADTRATLLSPDRSPIETPYGSKSVQHLKSSFDRVKQTVSDVLQQPIEQVAHYFGGKIAFYFAWTEMYTRWLVLPSLFGIALFIVQTKTNSPDHPLAPLYAVFLVIWSSTFLLAWKRKAAVLAHSWGSLGVEEEEVTRPEFHVNSDSMKGPKKYYVTCLHAIKLSVSSFMIISSVILLALLTCAGFAERDRLEMNYLEIKASADSIVASFVKLWRTGTFSWSVLPQLLKLHLGSGFWFYFLLTPILYGLLIPFLDICYTACARWMTNWENHATESRYQNHLIVKVFAFRFVHVFASLYYYTFASTAENPQHVAPTQQSSRFLRLSMQLATLMILGQSCKTLLSFLELWLALRKKKHVQQDSFLLHMDSLLTDQQNPLEQTHRASNRWGRSTLIACSRIAQASDPAWEQAQRAPYDTFQDFTEMILQFGYVTFFSIAFPLAPFFALCNNLLKLRLDAYKLCHVKQRPRSHNASDIGIWGSVLQLMSVIAIGTNSLHLFYTTTQLELWFPVLQSNETLRICMVFLVEHILLAFKMSAIMMIPKHTRSTKENIQRERHNQCRLSIFEVRA